MARYILTVSPTNGGFNVTDHTRMNGSNSVDGLDNPLIDIKDDYPAPLHMPYKARKFWESTLQSLPQDWFITADLVLFEIYCMTYIQYNEYRVNAENNELYEDEKGILRKTPWVDMVDKARASLIALTGKLKFNPKSRDADTLSPSRKKAHEADLKNRKGRRNGLMFIPGGKRDEAEKPSV
jgi:P27 family predicted phage terminase small subunit